MSRAVLSFALLTSLMLAGCGKKALKDKVVGKWKSAIELDDAKVDGLLKDAPEAQKEASKKMMAETITKMSIEIDMKSDGTYEVTMTKPGGEPDVTKGKWEVVSEEGDELKIKVTEDGKSKTNTLNLKFSGDDEFGFSTDDKNMKEAPIKIPIKFSRVK